MVNEIYLSIYTTLDYGDNSNVPHVLMMFVFPTLACLSLLGNTLFIVSIACTELKKKTTGMLLMSSNISSMIQTVASSCIVYYPWLFEQQSLGEHFPCNILIVTYHALAAWSVYLLMFACIDRYISICHSLSSFVLNSQSALKTCIKVVVATFIFSCVLGSPLVWYSALTVIEEVPGVGNITFCYYTEENWYMEIHEYLEMSLYSIIPFIVIMFCNAAIIRKIYFHRAMLESFQNPQNVGLDLTCKRLPHINRAVRLASILLPISILHLVFSGVVVISIILEDAIATTALQKLTLLTVSYNAAQLQAGYYFYANITMCRVYRNLFKKLFCLCRTPVETSLKIFSNSSQPMQCRTNFLELQPSDVIDKH
ncbi:hypothetical protein LOTGIDRAFT_175279 [Lottia gigantea]|uniref:G-protein coupled receptors family 1 profile domain-containing protein n=1 Tax=Lottia gigantea TaxID=225164 RepID=V4ADK4_LOTGI|nr:hypothetical protein LOTGIDRAFT_175279 [Lottia gigantea]ESO94927.1 hypothetical protein LOTGIDRAFT_175279 [Lottia gigantea]